MRFSDELIISIVITFVTLVVHFVVWWLLLVKKIWMKDFDKLYK